MIVFIIYNHITNGLYCPKLSLPCNHVRRWGQNAFSRWDLTWTCAADVASLLIPMLDPPYTEVASWLSVLLYRECVTGNSETPVKEGIGRAPSEQGGNRSGILITCNKAYYCVRAQLFVTTHITMIFSSCLFQSSASFLFLVLADFATKNLPFQLLDSFSSYCWLLTC